MYVGITKYFCCTFSVLLLLPCQSNSQDRFLQQEKTQRTFRKLAREVRTRKTEGEAYDERKRKFAAMEEKARLAKSEKRLLGPQTRPRALSGSGSGGTESSANLGLGSALEWNEQTGNLGANDNTVTGNDCDMQGV
jgi:hypothetical protein